MNTNGGGGGGSDAGTNGDAVNGGEDNEGVDPYDLLEPVDILTKLPKDFKEKLVCSFYSELNTVPPTKVHSLFRLFHYFAF